MKDKTEMTFLERIEEELGGIGVEYDDTINEETLITEEDELDDWCLLSLDEEELASLREEFDFDEEEMSELLEATARRVNSRGSVSRVRSKKSRQQNASRTTGMSRTERKRRAKKSARTRKKNPGTLRRAVKKRNKAMRRRKAMNIK
jgi:hypothetical protein